MSLEKIKEKFDAAYKKARRPKGTWHGFDKPFCGVSGMPGVVLASQVLELNALQDDGSSIRIDLVSRIYIDLVAAKKQRMSQSKIDALVQSEIRKTQKRLECFAKLKGLP